MPEAKQSHQPRFQQLQYQFAAHLRDPQANPAPESVEARRMRIYAELFYKNMAGFLAGAFPVLHKLYADEDWHALVRLFYAQHVSHSPQFYQIAGEFLDYLQHEHQTRDCDPVFLLELAHYEWVEMMLAIDPSEPDRAAIDPQGDLLASAPVVTPWLYNLSYQFDVQRIGPSYQPDAPPEQPTFLAVF
ncbi:MAG: DNA-binding domain-containing protein, partial [Nevskiales bacterium]